MPEFILDHGSPDAARAFKALDAFTQGYVEAMFFTDTGYPENEELEHATVAELAPRELEAIKATCAAFQERAEGLLELAYEREGYDEEAAGRDLWYTRNGHGVGFWDREVLDCGGLGEQLTAACGFRTDFDGVDLYRGDDGLIYGHS